MNWPLALGGLALLMAFRSDGGAKTDESAMPHALLLVVNQGDQSLSIVDPGSGKQVGKIKTHGIRGHEVIAWSLHPLTGSSLTSPFMATPE